MNFVTLSKILPVLIFPYALVLWLLLLALVLALFRRIGGAMASMAVAIAILVLCGNPNLSYALYARHERIHLPQAVEAYPRSDVIIVLGGALGLPLAPRTSSELTGASDRILHGVRLYRAGKADTVLIAGGNVFPQPGVEAESFYIRQLMEEWGVPGARILVEGRSRNTYENAIYARDIMAEKNFRTALLVTSALHMPRALAVFRDAGIDAVPAPTDLNIVDVNQPRLLNWMPTLGAMAAFTEVLKEKLGILVYRYRGWIRGDVAARP